MKTTTTLFIGEDEIKTVGKMPSIYAGPCSKVRASIVVPVKPRSRRTFYRLRFLLGNTLGGWLSRRLPGPWKAVILSSGEKFQAQTRAECIRWEVERLEQMMSNN